MDSMQKRLNRYMKENFLPAMQKMDNMEIWQVGFEMGLDMAMLHPEWVQAYSKQVGIEDGDRKGADALTQEISVNVVQEEPHEQ